jgi:hypothetical protein
MSSLYASMTYIIELARTLSTLSSCASRSVIGKTVQHEHFRPNITLCLYNDIPSATDRMATRIQNRRQTANHRMKRLCLTHFALYVFEVTENPFPVY